MTVAEARGRGFVRYLVILILFVVTTINYADRATLSLAGAPMQRELGVGTVQMGYIFSAFGWAYVLGQLPGGALLDRFGARRVYLCSILLWSVFTLAQGFIAGLAAGTAVALFFALRFLLGLAESPAFPANARIVAMWFPRRERGTATAIFNSAQYFALVAFAPLMAVIATDLGWRYIFILMGVLGLATGALFALTVHAPARHPWLRQPEYDHLVAGGALVALDDPHHRPAQRSGWTVARQLLGHRLLLSIYAGQYFITALTYFYSTWFPLYLIRHQGLSLVQAGVATVLPGLSGWIGGILGGLWTDWLVRRGASLSVARKLPIAVGALLSTGIVVCNVASTTTLLLLFMTLAFFGKGLASLGWVVIADVAPAEAAGLTGGMFNAISNVAGIVTPIAIGYLIAAAGSFDMALIFVAVHALLGAFCFCVASGPIRRLSLSGGTLHFASTSER